jgi:hypothetical protein
MGEGSWLEQNQKTSDKYNAAVTLLGLRFSLLKVSAIS